MAHILDPVGSNEDQEINNLEIFKLDETAKIIHSAGILLKCTIFTRTKALLIYHHFRSCVLETEYNPHTIAAACLNLSIKNNQEEITLESVVHLIFCMIDQTKMHSTQSMPFKATLKTVGLVEALILRMLEFDLSHTIAHQFLAYFMNDFQEELSVSNHWDVFAETCMRYASDFYLSSKCRTYNADEIAIAVVHASLYMLGVDCDYFRRKLKMLNNCPESKIQSIIEDIVSICLIGPRVESRERMDGGRMGL